jgi:hypothetical protein
MRQIINCATGEVTIIPPTPEELLEEAWDSLRAERNSRLSSSDWTQVPDSSVDKSAWAIYRQALRDLPQNTTDPLNPVWPVPPT